MTVRALYAACLVLLPVSVLAQASNPWFGTWKLRLKSADEKPETLIYSDAGNGSMRMMSLEDGSIIVTRFDGNPSPNIGKRGSREPLLAVKATSPTSYTWTYFKARKPYVQGVNTLAADRRTFTEISWLVGKPAETVTLIYDRQ